MIEIDHSGMGASYFRTHPNVRMAHEMGETCALCDTDDRTCNRCGAQPGERHAIGCVGQDAARAAAPAEGLPQDYQCGWCGNVFPTRWASTPMAHNCPDALVANPGAPAEGLRVVEAMENEGVVTWGDDGHRARFLAALTPEDDR